MTILDQLAAYAHERTEQAKKQIPLEAIKRQALSLPQGDFAFEKALQTPDIAFICECKKASPSKGLIAPIFRISRSPGNMSRQAPTAFPC